MVEHHYPLVVLTAAHCLPFLPPAHPFSYLEERTYQALLGPLGAKAAVWAQCLFADPVADIAMLGSPDEQRLSEQANAFDDLISASKPLLIGNAPKQGRERAQLPGGGKFGGTFFRKIPGRSTARVLSLDGKWLDCSIER